MGLMAKSKAALERPPVGRYAGRCISVIDLGRQRSEYKGQQQIRHKVLLRV